SDLSITVLYTLSLHDALPIYNNETTLLPVAFIDDDKRKQQLDILGIPVIGGVTDIAKTVQELHIDNIIIAIPSLHKKKLNIIFQDRKSTRLNSSHVSISYAVF